MMTDTSSNYDEIEMKERLDLIQRAFTDDNLESQAVEEYYSPGSPPLQSNPMINVSQQRIDEITNRPSIYTFFDRIHLEHRSTGMTDEDDDKMLNLWKSEWEAAGFNTFILTMEDAKRHPRFQEFEETLERVPLNSRNKAYNQMCYFRHLAMSTVGGGYMSDYDVLPVLAKSTIIPFPEHGQILDANEDIVVYSATPKNGGIPCLMSGGGMKWEDLSFALLESGLRHPNEKMWTDMFAMVDLKDSLLYKVTNTVIKFSGSHDASPTQCDYIKKHVAVHFSHHGLKKVHKTANQRPEVAEQWLQEWRSSCDL